jgi:integrin-linked kinase-associated serine/threonine phosphatase 2C
VTSFELSARDEFVLLACDGFWDLWSADDAVATASAMLQEGREPKVVTNRLLNITVRERRCKDNCTIMLLKFVKSDGAAGAS